jgi:nucleotidyltransferase substrate binding protein (TIGR01987 family)
MSRLSDIRETTQKNINGLNRILAEPYSDIIRDAAIRRFDMTFETFWRVMREYLREEQGVVCTAPKECFRRVFEAGLIDMEETELFIAMTNDRNIEMDENYWEKCDIVFGRLKGYAEAMGRVVGRVKG